MSFLRRAIPSALVASTLFLFVPGRAAEPDPKAISYALPDNIEWKKGAASDTAILQGDPFQAWHLRPAHQVASAQHEQAAYA